MSVKIYSIESLRKENRNKNIETEIPYEVAGETRRVPKKMVNGELEVPVLSKPAGELMTTDPGMEEMMEKVVLDVELGRERVPTVYEPIYDRLEDPNFPRILDAKWALEGMCIFLKRLEGNDVKMGAIAAHEGPIARIESWAAGFEYTEEMVLYDHGFEVEVLNRAFGEAYNALLNHIHLFPIIDFNYTSDNQTSSEGEDGEPYALQIKKTLRQALKDCVNARRPANTLLASKEHAGDIEDALETMLYDGTEYASIGAIDNIIYYDGWQTKVGKKTYTYEGCPSDKAYLIRPNRGFKELVKVPLRIDGQPGPIRRLVEEQIVGRTHRGVFAAVEENVQEVNIDEVTNE